MIKELIRPNILALKPYSTARDEFSGGDIEVWLDANENPFDNGANRYPDPRQKALKAKIAPAKGVDVANVFIGNGSDEAIDVLFRIFCRPGVDNAVSIAPTYGMYGVTAGINDIEMREVQLNGDFSLPVERLLAAADANSKLLWICSPNNPTGNAFPREEIEKLLRGFRGIVVVDEAYADFSSEKSLVDLIGKYPNLVVMQTMSKAQGLAAIRVGMAFASPEIIGYMDRVKYPYNVNALSQAYALENFGGKEEQTALIIKEREKLAEALKDMPAVERIYPSDANFLLVKVVDADGLYDALIEMGVIVRNRSRVKGCEGCLRITVGTPEENLRVMDGIRNFKNPNL